MFVHIMPISYGLTLTFRLGSVLATLSVTLERFFAIVFPLKNVRRLKRWLIPGSVILTGKWTFKENIQYVQKDFFALNSLDACMGFNALYFGTIPQI